MQEIDLVILCNVRRQELNVDFLTQLDGLVDDGAQSPEKLQLEAYAI